MIQRITRRLRLAWKQMLAGLRGHDLRDIGRIQYLAREYELAHWKRCANSRRVEVCMIDTIDAGYGIDGFEPKSDVTLKRIRARRFTVPVAFLEGAGELTTHVDFAVSREHCRSTRDDGKAMIEQLTRRAAAEMGIALVMGQQPKPAGGGS